MIFEILFGISFIVLILIGIKLYLILTTRNCRSQVCLKGKTVIVVGANTGTNTYFFVVSFKGFFLGIGFETAIDFAKRGARVIVGCRNEKSAKEAVEKIKKETHNTNVIYKLIDLSSFKSVKKFAADIKSTEDRLDILVNNAAAAGLPDELTEDGCLVVMQINYFSHFLLTHLLLGKIIFVYSTSQVAYLTFF